MRPWPGALCAITDRRRELFWRLGSLPAVQAQEQNPEEWTQARTPDGHPDMQGMWARRGVATPNSLLWMGWRKDSVPFGTPSRSRAIAPRAADPSPTLNK